MKEWFVIKVGTKNAETTIVEWYSRIILQLLVKIMFLISKIYSIWGIEVVSLAFSDLQVYINTEFAKQVNVGVRNFGVWNRYRVTDDR